jgi:hypothetical protein
VNAASAAACALAGLFAHAALAADDAPHASTRVYDFEVRLDDRPIGHHRFEVAEDGDARRVTSAADLAVTVLGLRLHGYRHRAEERWSGGCLVALSASTDDDGRATAVRLERRGDVDDIAVDGRHAQVAGCVASYAYWDPALLARQSRLLDPQNGRVDAVAVERAGAGTVTVGGRAVEATRWRIAGPDAPIDVWVSAAGEWIGLDSTVRHGTHRLSYRLP